MPPSGYSDWHAWAAVQHKAGLRQQKCGRCLKYKYPQALSDLIDEYEAETSRGKVVQVTSPVCLTCAAEARKS